MDSLYFSALQSFVVLARTSRMQEATKELGVSRQTIMRHLNHLYELRGGPLLKLQGNSYFTTECGAEFLIGAERLLEQAHALAGRGGLCSETIDGLERVYLDTAENESFRSQQHPLWRIKDIGAPIIKRAFQGWLSANFDIMHPGIQDQLQLLILLRRQQYGWVCTHVGETSAYARWFGKEWAMSAVGSLQSEAPSGHSYQVFTSQPYEHVLNSGSCYFDHHYLKLESHREGPSKYVMYQRLLMPVCLPDSSPTLASLVIITKNVQFSGFILPMEARIPENLIMDN